MRRGQRGSLASLLLAVALCRCAAKDPTAFYVEVTAGPGVPAAFVLARIRIVNPATMMADFGNTTVLNRGFPFTVLVEKGTMSPVTIEVSVYNSNMGGMPRPDAVGRAVVTFIDNQVLKVPITVYTGCAAAGMDPITCRARPETCPPPLSACPPNQTCTSAGTCVSAEQRSLVRYVY